MQKLSLLVVASLALAGTSCMATKNDIDLSYSVDSMTLGKTAAGKLAGSVTVTITLGGYAMGPRTVHPQTVDVFDSSRAHILGTVNVGSAAAYNAVFMPGDTRTTTFPLTCDGSSDCGAATICASSSAPINFLTLDVTTSMPTSHIQQGMATIDCATVLP